MRTMTDVRDWIQGAALEFGDPAETVGQIFARFVSTDEQSDDCLATVMQNFDGQVIVLKGVNGPGWLPIPIEVAGMLIDQDTGQLIRFGLEQVCPGVWTIA